MKKMKILILTFFMISILALSAFSQKVATTSMQFLKVMPCARASALGDAYSVWASGAEAVFWNPAGVALTQSHEFSGTFINWIFDARQGAISYALSLGDLGALGFQIQYVDYGTFEEAVLYQPAIKSMPNPGLTGREFKAYSYLIGATYAKSLTERFSTGLTVKYAHESLFDQAKVIVVNPNTGKPEEVNTYGNVLLFDFGMHYNTGFRSIEVAASVQNFGPQIKYAFEKSPAPMLFRVGVAADLIGQNGLLFIQKDNRFGLALDLFQPNDYAQQLHVGVEYEYAKTIALRAGYKYNYDSEGLTLGGGIRQNLGSMSIAVDYSYGLLETYLSNVHRISLGVILQ